MIECPMCRHTESTAAKMEEHVNRQHFDLTSPAEEPQTNKGPRRDSIEDEDEERISTKKVGSSVEMTRLYFRETCE